MWSTSPSLIPHYMMNYGKNCETFCSFLICTVLEELERDKQGINEDWFALKFEPCKKLKIRTQRSRRGQDFNVVRLKCIHPRFILFIYVVFFFLVTSFILTNPYICAFTLMTEPFTSHCFPFALGYSCWCVVGGHRLHTQHEKTNPYYILITG